MKIEKNIYVYSGMAIIIIGAVFLWLGRNNKTGDPTDTSKVVSSSEGLNQSPSPTSKVSKNSPTATPGVVANEVKDYRYWVNLLDPIDRRLTLDENCTSIVPSQVAYPNNTQIMIDNAYSTSPRTLKIGTKEYSLTARGWLIITLSSTKLPAQLTMFCGPMELGQLDLQ